MTTNDYTDHRSWTQHLAELGFLKASHNPCLVSDYCLAEEDDSGEEGRNAFVDVARRR